MPRVTIPQIEPTPNTTLPCVPNVEQFMCRDMCVATPDTLLADVVRRMIQTHTAVVPVVESGEEGLHLLGLLSDRDCLTQLSNEAFFGNPYQPKEARTVMRPPAAVVSPKTDVFTLIALFNEHDCDALPVIEDSRLTGMVRRCDALKAIDQYYDCTQHIRRRRRCNATRRRNGHEE